MNKRFTLFAATAALLASTSIAGAATLEEMQKQIDDISAAMRVMQAEKAKETEKAAQPAAPSIGGDGSLKKVWDKTTFGGYGELAYIFKKENGNGNGGNSFDPQRFVLYVNSELSDWITMNSELEWEHGGSDGGEDGSISVEQAFLDFKLAKPFNVKAGVMLVPVGAINQYHEPTNFNSTERPQLDRYLIPTTWQEMGVSAHGALGNKADYQIMASPGLDGRGFAGETGIREGRQNFGKDSNRNIALSGRLELRPVTNLYTNLSFFTGNSAPSGKATAYTTIAAFDGKYNIGRFDIAGEYVHIYQDNPQVLSDEIGHTMSGYWVEGACHLMPASWKQGKLADSDLVVFGRWSEFDTQQGKIANPSKASGRFDRNYTTFGVVFKPTTTVAIKADYQIYDDHRKPGETPLDNDKFQLTLGFVF
jgi:hypothetical protein